MSSNTRGVKRAKSGCITCRIRRVKCDGRHCDGYSTLPFSRKDLQEASRSVSPHPGASAERDTLVGVLPRLITDPAFEDLVEKRYFQFFRQKSVASNNHLVDTRFWDRLVLQACHSEPAIKHAVLALSSLHQLDQLPQGGGAALQHKDYAERQHQKALAAAQRLISTSSSQTHDFDRVLTACVIFILFESVRGDYKAAATHMRSGRAIIAQHAARLKHPGRRKDLLEIEQTLGRLDLTAVFFQDQSAPYEYSVDDFHKTNPVTVPYAFSDIHDAQTCLIDLNRWLLITEEYIQQNERSNDLAGMAKYQAEKLRCNAQLTRWGRHFEDMLDRTKSSNELVVLNLKAWYAYAMLIVKAESYGPETRYDAFMSDFETIISCAAEIATSTRTSAPASMFSYEIGYLAPLYFAATRCRDPVLRRRAIAVMREHPRQEGVMESVAAGHVANAWMVAEEGALVVNCASDIPDYRRITTTDTTVDVKNREATLGLNRRGQSGEKPTVFVSWRCDEQGKAI